ncbi:MAG: hypothetical protein PHI78_04155, partial [Clostridia bacterium]|nr:hypothetical protein [Clostridia bacterium]
MKKKVLALILSLLLVFTTIVGLAGCKTQYTGGDTLVVGYSYFSQKFSAFFAKTAYDQDVATMTGVALLG